MKTTIELPQQLMEKVEKLAAREQRTVDELVTEIVRANIERLENRPRPAVSDQQLTPEQWMANWLKMADEAMRDAPPGPTAREILEEDRNRLERR